MEKNNKKTFPPTSDGLKDAIDWAKKQSHSHFSNKTLYDELYDESLDGFMNLYKINEAKLKLDKNNEE